MTNQHITPAIGSFFWPLSVKNKNENAKNHRFPRFSRFCCFKPLFFNGLLFIINFSFFSFFSLLIKAKRYRTRRNEAEKSVQTAESQCFDMKTRETREKPHSIRKTTLIQVAAINNNPNTFAQ